MFLRALRQASKFGRVAYTAPNDADGWTVNEAITCKFVNVSKYNVDEVLRLRAHSAWYEEMNEYRNVWVHRGWREQRGGFFPIGSTLPEAADPKLVMLATRNLTPESRLPCER